MKANPMDDRLLQELSAWLDFYRDMGFEGLYLPPVSERTRSSPATNSAGGSAPGPSAASDATDSNEPSGAAPALGMLPPQSAQKANAAPLLPASSRNFSLFEPAPPPPKLKETLDEIRFDLGDCHRCRLSQGRKTIVFGQGNPRAELVFVGEGPGADEDEQGLPFVGRAGQLLNRMIQAIGLRREEVYICNVVKCRPPGNRTPAPDEIETCSPFLYRQIEAIRPKLICCLGAPAVRTVLGVKEGITKIRGRFYEYAGVKALATVHPAYILRNPREEKILREDFEKIREFLRAAR